MSGRTSEDREAARLERERKRAAREGRPFPEPTVAAPEPPAEPAAPEPPAASGPPEPAAPEPPAAPEEPIAPEDWQSGAPVGPQSDSPHPDSQATQQWDVSQDWTGEHSAAEPPPGQRDDDAPPTEQYDVAADWTSERFAITTAPVETDAPAPVEAPLGTRRVAPHEHPRLATRGAKKPGSGRRAAPTPAAGAGEGAAAGGRGGAGGRRGKAAAGPPAAPRPHGRMRRRAFALIPLALIVLAGWFLISLYQPFAGDPGSRVIVRIPSGAGVSDVGDLLVAKGVVPSAFFFRLRASLAGDSGKLKSGRFTLRQDMTYPQALDAITKTPPPPPTIRITLPEGPSRGELAARVKQAGVRGRYVAASRGSKQLNPRRYGAPKGATLEGFLFPATYELKRGATAKQLVAEQLTAFKQNLASVDLSYAKRKNLTTFDVLTIASMVEREVAVPKERRLVAAVIYNRLREGIPLGIDATLRFALDNWTSPLKVSELASTTPYNTRNHQGLPPGPIGNPGLASIKAAAHPAKVGYLFYVVKPGTCGQHAFSSTDAQFQQDVAKYNAAREAAGGKSPTTC